MEQNNKKKTPAFEINQLVKETYNKIAQWHNEEATSTSLHNLSVDIVSEIIRESYKHLDLKVDFAIDMDDELREKVEKEKQKNKRRIGINDLSTLTDEDLMSEILKRKTNQ